MTVEVDLSETIDQDLRRTLQIAQAPYLPIPWQYRAIKIRAALAEDNWRIITHWLYRFAWDKDHKIPVPRKIARGWKPFAAIIYSLMEIAQKCHFYKAGGASRYRDSTLWFQCILIEWKLGGFLDALEESECKGEGLVQYRSEVRREWRLLQEGKNPYSLAKNPHTHTLIEAAIQLKKAQPNFAGYWNCLTEAFHQWKCILDKPLDSGVRAIRCINGEIRIQQSKGRATSPIQLQTDELGNTVLYIPTRIKTRDKKT